MGIEMYESFFGLRDRPFQLTPDPRFWFDTATHKKAMAYLGYGLAQREGFIVITGDIGTGKTTLMGHLTQQIDPASLNVITIVSTAVEHEDLLRIVATGLDVEAAGKSKAELLLLIERGLHAVARGGRRTLLIVDEAQALPHSALEELRMLSNFQAGGHAMLQIFLLGQPEFRDRLTGSDRLEQLRQRVIAVHHLDPMGASEVSAYVTHRLGVAGWQGRPDFAPDSFAALHRASEGVPRRLNQLMSRVLLHASIAGEERIDAALIRAIVTDHERELPGNANAAPQRHDRAVPRMAIVPPAPPRADENEAPPPFDARLVERVAQLEARVEEQDAALRRVLKLMVDWVENDAARSETVKGAA